MGPKVAAFVVRKPLPVLALRPPMKTPALFWAAQFSSLPMFADAIVVFVPSVFSR